MGNKLRMNQIYSDQGPQFNAGKHRESELKDSFLILPQHRLLILESRFKFLHNFCQIVQPFSFSLICWECWESNSVNRKQTQGSDQAINNSSQLFSACWAQTSTIPRPSHGIFKAWHTGHQVWVAFQQHCWAYNIGSLFYVLNPIQKKIQKVEWRIKVKHI